MKCPKCGYENREGAGFCAQCGQSFAAGFRDMKMQPWLERALRHKDILKAQAVMSSNVPPKATKSFAA